jgi:hypothetical protein
VDIEVAIRVKVIPVVPTSEAIQINYSKLNALVMVNLWLAFS